MARLFPSQFSIEAFKGPRRDFFVKREDAFQQLVGDALRESFGSEVFVSPTLGKDGGVDAFVRSRDTTAVEQLGLESPFIVECKDVGNSGGDNRKKILAGWSRTCANLKMQAECGWSQEWRQAKSYLYCTSAIITIATRNLIHERIATFFDELAPSRSLALKTIRIMDWDELRNWFDNLARLRDRWLGIGLQKLLGHEEYISNLTSFSRFLLPDVLPFFSPPPAVPWHPDKFFEKISNSAGNAGILLLGPGGVGKTRILLEVAQRSHAAGWRIIHILSGTPPVREDELGEVILQGGDKPTLLVIDYLDQVQLDIGTIRGQLLALAESKGLRVVLLANARPVYRLTFGSELENFFEIIEISLERQFARTVSLEIQRTVAPLAISRLGVEKVSELCGERPIIALLIGLELEERCAKKDEISLSGLQAGDLGGWMRRRLQGDQLWMPKPSSVYEEPMPDEFFLSATGAMAAAPQREELLIAVARQILKSRDSDRQAEYLIGRLKDLGLPPNLWVKSRPHEPGAGGRLAAFHHPSRSG